MAKNWDEKISVTLTRQEWFDITGALGHDVFEGSLNEQYEKIWSVAFPEDGS